jgi:ADP-heptose:LPS heptosyltransferase
MSLGKDMKWEMVPYVRGVGVAFDDDMTNPLFSHFISSTQQRTRRIDWKNPVQFQNLDYVFSASVAARLWPEKTPGLFRTWMKLLKPGGHLIFTMDEGTIPASRMVEYMRSSVNNWSLDVWKTYQDEDSELYLQIYKNTTSGGQVINTEDKIHPNSALVIRYGAIGDCIIASSILPGLKDQGYHVVFNTQETGHSILSNNPHIDEFLLQDKEQIPNEELPGWWMFLKDRYKRVINLSGTMEQAICTMPGTPDFTWPRAVREKYRGANYYEFLHDMAEVPMPVRSEFFPTREETKIAERKLRKIGEEKFVIMWVLSGSAVHKRVPQVPEVMDYILKDPNVHVIFVGDEFCKVLEESWSNHQQVTCTSGEWSIRETLTMTQHVDLVIGPETGVVQLAGIQGTPTVVLLSHTSEDTLCRYWKDYMALVAEGCECHPCYRQHYTRDYCDVDDEVPAARCIREIPAGRIIHAIDGYKSVLQRREVG